MPTDATLTPDPTIDLPWWARNTDSPRVQPSTVRSRTRKKVFTGLCFTAVAISGLVVASSGFTDKQTESLSGGGVSTRQTTEALLAGCGRQFTLNTSVRTNGIVPKVRPDGALYSQVYPTIVPMFGRFWNDPVDTSVQRFWTTNAPNRPVPEQALMNMWRGQMTVWYTPTVKPDDLAVLKRLTTSRPALNMIVAPWKPSLGPLPSNRNFAFSVWGSSQTCARFTIDSLVAFRAAHPSTAAPGSTGQTPPILRLQTKATP